MERFTALRDAMRESGIDLVVVGPTANMRYLLGYRAMAVDRLTVLLVTLDGAAMIMPYFDAEEFREVTGFREVFEWADKDGPAAAVGEAFRALGTGVSAVAAVDGELRFDFFNRLSGRFAGRPLDANDLFAGLRLAKGADELARIRRAGDLVSHGVDVAFDSARPGMSELELKRVIENALWQQGAESVDFVLVQAGTNSAVAHHSADRTRFREGEPVLIDIAARVEGYFADITQQVFFGDPSQEYREAYGVVTAAQEAGVKAARAGARAGDVDRAASAVIESAGLGAWNGPRTGHGIGLDVHEPPSVMSGDETELVSGCVITVEPGVYMPNKFGVRIEDTVIVADNGPERVTRGARPLFSTD